MRRPYKNHAADVRWVKGSVGRETHAKQTQDAGQETRMYRSACEETLSVTEEIVRVEKEIDERVKGLYGI